VKAAWRSVGDERPGTRLLRSPLSALAQLYGLCTAVDRERYALGLKARRAVDAKVVSVGGLVAGGSGKTPMSSWLAEQLHRRGHRVALLSRGHRGRRRERVTMVSDGRSLLVGPERAGDEPFVLAGQAVGVPVFVSKDRVLAALRAIAVSGAEILVLDDGFQHHQLARDLDLLTIDAVFGFGNGRLLPRGALREPVRALERVDAIAELDGALPEAVEAVVRKYAPDVFRFRAERRAVGLRALEGRLDFAPAILQGMRVGMIAGIARPESFRATLEGLGAEIVSERLFRDHHRYRARDLRGLSHEADIWITTEKDACKILPQWTGQTDVRVLGMRAVVVDANPVLDWIEARLDLGSSTPG